MAMADLISAARRLTKRFRASDAGNMTMIATLAAIPMVGAAGMAIDYARISRVKDQIQYTADAATLFAAGAKTLGGTMADKRNTRQQLATNYLKFGAVQYRGRRNPRPADGGCRRCGNQRRGQGQGLRLLHQRLQHAGRRRQYDGRRERRNRGGPQPARLQHDGEVQGQLEAAM